MTEASASYGTGCRGVSPADVARAADALMRGGERPTVEKVRTRLGTGSPNTITPLLDAWWKRLAGRLDAGPAAFHRLPESVAHVAEALWMQALEEGRRRATIELQGRERAVAANHEESEVRSHVLTLREGELDSRLQARERTISDLELQLREARGLLRKERASSESHAREAESLRTELLNVQQRARVRAPRKKSPTTSPTKTKTATPKKPRAKWRPGRPTNRKRRG